MDIIVFVNVECVVCYATLLIQLETYNFVLIQLGLCRYMVYLERREDQVLDSWLGDAHRHLRLITVLFTNMPWAHLNLILNQKNYFKLCRTTTSFIIEIIMPAQKCNFNTCLSRSASSNTRKVSWSWNIFRSRSSITTHFVYLQCISLPHAHYSH